MNLESEGVKVKASYLDLNFFNTIQPDTEILSLPKLEVFFLKKVGSEAIEFNTDRFKHLIQAVSWLQPDGSGTIPRNLTKMPVAVFWLLCGFIRFKLDILVKKLRNALHSYISQYLAGKLHSGSSENNRPLKADVARTILLSHLNELQAIQQDPLIWNLGQDEFEASLAKHSPDLHRKWKKGKMNLHLFEALFSLEQTRDIQITGIKGQITNPESIHPLDRYGLNEVAIQTEIQIVFEKTGQNTSSQKITAFQKSDSIQIIQVVKTNTDRFAVYLNYQTNPLFLSKKRKNGELFYKLAEKGKVKHNHYFARTFETIQTDPRFLFFAKTKFKQMPLLELDDNNNIVVVKGVEISLVNQSGL